MGVILGTAELGGGANIHFAFQVKPAIPKLSAQKRCSPAAGRARRLHVPWAQGQATRPTCDQPRHPPSEGAARILISAGHVFQA